MNTTTILDALTGKKYLNLETYRRNGTGVRTPVWFAAAPADPNGPVLYVYTTANAGKAKRIRRTSTVKIASCDARGTPTGPWIDATATIVTGDEYTSGMKLLDRKYFPLKQVLDLSMKLFGRHQRIMIAIRATAG
jgi:PPOX class probable F420-dependent enzyme